MSDEPREVLTFLPPGGVFQKADYPWLKAVRVTLRGGDSAAGHPGGTNSQTLPVDALPDLFSVTVGHGVGAHCLVELYEEPNL